MNKKQIGRMADSKTLCKGGQHESKRRRAKVVSPSSDSDEETVQVVLAGPQTKEAGDDWAAA